MNETEEFEFRARAERESAAGPKPSVDKAAIAADMQRMADPTAGTSFPQQFAEGMGKAFTDVGRGAAQLVGAGPSAQETQEIRRRDAPLMGTGGGVTGNIAGNIAAFAPAALIPGANTVAGAGAVGATMGALQPAEGVGERMGNMAVGGGLGAGAQFAGSTGAQMLGERAGKKQALADALRSRNAMRDETLGMAKEAGYVVPPSAVNPSFLNKRLESVAGKAAVGQEAAARNQATTNALASRALGLPDDQPITEAALKQFRERVSEPYRKVASISQEASDALETLKDARFNANAYHQFYSRSGDPAALKQAKDYSGAAQALEKRIEDLATQSGQPQLVAALRKSRTQIAKSYDVEKALNVATGDISAPAIGKSLDKGRPLTDELSTIGRFSEAFPSYAREGAKIPTPGVSKSEALAAALLATAGGAAGGPAGVLAGALPLASGPTRSAVLSAPYQKLMAQPKYSSGIGTDAMATLKNPKTREQLALALRAMLPATGLSMENQ